MDPTRPGTSGECPGSADNLDPPRSNGERCIQGQGARPAGVYALDAGLFLARVGMFERA